MRHARFGKVLLLSDRPPPPRIDSAIAWRQIAPLASRSDYSRFMLRNLAEHIETSHALCVQWDGFVLNAQAWDPQFLEYDYIGAVWPHFADGHNVGNGGFSLRSRRLLEACTKLPFDEIQPEDVVIGRVYRRRLEEQGLRFAPDSVARRFAYERTPSTGKEFGFHGAFNLVRYLRRKDALRLFGALEKGMIAPNERWHIFRWALLRGRLGLALQMLRRKS
jgi:hypothetical protein